MKIKRKFILVGLMGLVVAFSFVGCRMRGLFARHPNVIFIVFDAARADHFSCYGYPKQTTPNIDAIAKQSVVFENNFSQATWTAPSLASIFSSRYKTPLIFETDAWVWGIKQEDPAFITHDFDAQEAFLPKVLSDNGYETVLFYQHGWFKEETFFTQLFQEHFYLKRPNKEISSIKDSQDYQRVIKQQADPLISWIRKHRIKPYFLYWHIMFPHESYFSTLKQRQFFDQAEDNETIERFLLKIQEGGEFPIENEHEKRLLQGFYDSQLYFADNLVKALYQGLEKQGALGNTLLIISADHGQNIGDHNLCSHRGLPWDSVIHIPLIMSYPGKLPQGKRISGLTESVDIMPTILDYCKIPVPPGKFLDGVSLRAVITGSSKGKDAVFAEWNGSIGMRTKTYKYLAEKGQLFDLRSDPAEENNIAQSQIGVAEEMKKISAASMAPYEKRFQETKRQGLPFKPFYYYLEDMDISGDIRRQHVFQKVSFHDAKFLELRNSPESRSFWLFNEVVVGHSPLIMYSGKDKALPVITIRCPLLNGDCWFAFLIESEHPMQPEEAKYFKFRLKGWPNLQEPVSMSLYRNKETDNHFYYYLNCGAIPITNGRFEIELHFTPPYERQYIFQHIKFFYNQWNNDGTPLSDKELLETKENLKSLGYL